MSDRRKYVSLPAASWLASVDHVVVACPDGVCPVGQAPVETSEHGRRMARTWQEHGKSMARTWQEHGNINKLYYNRLRRVGTNNTAQCRQRNFNIENNRDQHQHDLYPLETCRGMFYTSVKLLGTDTMYTSIIKYIEDTFEWLRGFRWGQQSNSPEPPNMFNLTSGGLKTI